MRHRTRPVPVQSRGPKGHRGGHVQGGAKRISKIGFGFKGWTKILDGRPGGLNAQRRDAMGASVWLTTSPKASSDEGSAPRLDRHVDQATLGRLGCFSNLDIASRAGHSASQ